MNIKKITVSIVLCVAIAASLCAVCSADNSKIFEESGVAKPVMNESFVKPEKQIDVTYSALDYVKPTESVQVETVNTQGRAVEKSAVGEKKNTVTWAPTKYGLRSGTKAGDVLDFDSTVSDAPSSGGMTYLGTYFVTGYDICVECCGNTNGITASGAVASVGCTVASNDFPFGTVLYIEGIGYRTVEDRGGMSSGVLDVLCNNHDECYAITGSYQVYIVN